MDLAIEIRNGYKRHGTEFTVKNFNMTVPQGALYSLIGSSGCGKTTVLSALVGISKLDSGTLRIFGSSCVANQLENIGYMPQDTALYDGLSIQENFYFFGLLFNSNEEKGSTEYIFNRVELLHTLMALPPLKQKVGTLSGGEKKRVSLAISLLNQPKLLVLDEPTSGLDPLLRKRIWQYLEYLVKEKHTTIILTTHYTEEAKHSSIIGVMRDGTLIEEDTPENLMDKYASKSVESAYLAICKLNEFSILDFNAKTPEVLISVAENKCECLQTEKCDKASVRKWESSIFRIWQITGKNFTTLFRNIWLLMFVSAIPALCMLVAYITFRHEAQHVPIGLVNDELDDGTICFNPYLINTCTFDWLSCNFIREIPEETIDLIPMKSKAEAIKATQAGNIWGYIYFPKNYSKTVTDFVINKENFTFTETEKEDSWNSTKVSVSLDQSNRLMSAVILDTLYRAFENSARNSFKSCGMDERLGDFPLQYGKPIVGQEGLSSVDYIAPGLAVGILYFFPTTLAIRFINERRRGTIERSIAGGAQLSEFLVGYALTEFGVIIAQSTLVHVIIHNLFDIGDSVASSPLNTVFSFLLCILQGIGGLAFGLLLGVICKQEIQAAMLIIAIIFPCSFISGLVWPVEGMPYLMQKLSLVSPMTLPAQSLRSMLNRGWYITHPVVWSGFLVSFVYILAFFLATMVLVKRLKT